jgi:serine/threonine protein kinase
VSATDSSFRGVKGVSNRFVLSVPDTFPIRSLTPFPYSDTFPIFDTFSIFPDDLPQIPGFGIERELGRGGMGVVYQAYQPSLKRRVALKVVRSGPSSGSRDLIRWLREAQAFSRVCHDNVVRLYQIGEADGWLYLVLELMAGGNLQDRLDRPYAARDAARLLETIAQAVAAIHREGLLHLDLKPSNILLDGTLETARESASPHVGDFGIAYRRDDPEASLATTTLAGPLGTPS